MKMEIGSTPAQVEPGRPAAWKIRILDAAGTPVGNFAPVHEKLMHLIIVSADLSWFNHLHPEYRGNGTFEVEVKVPSAGTYRVYADYMPEGSEQRVSQYEFTTTGASSVPASSPSTPDRIGADGRIVKSAQARPESEPDAPGGATYQVAMMPMPSEIAHGSDVQLHFQIMDASGRPVEDLEPYLGARGHTVVVSGDGKTYLHTHPAEGGMEGMNHGTGGHGEHTAGGGEKGGDVIFHTSFPEPGIYKVWGQFRHGGKIITASYVLNIAR